MKRVCSNLDCIYNNVKFGCVRAWPNKPFKYCPPEAIKNIQKEIKRLFLEEMQNG